MVDLSNAKPGMKAKIVDQWVPGCGQNCDGDMDKYLGMIVTVRYVSSDFRYIKIEEDRGDRGGYGWVWNQKCFDYLIVQEEEEADFDVPDDQFYSILFADKT